MKKNIFKIIDIVIIFLYALVILSVLTSVCSVKYFRVLPQDRSSFLLCVIFIIVLPVLASVGSFVIKRKKILSQICSVLIMLLVLISAIVYAVLFLLGGICSYTTDIGDYQEFDNRVLHNMSDDKPLFPNVIPEYAQDIEYEYLYRRTLDDEIAITLKYCYDSETAFEKEREEISKNQNVIFEEVAGERITYYTANSDRVIFVIFDYDQRAVLYGYFKEMSMEEIDNKVAISLN